MHTHEENIDRGTCSKNSLLQPLGRSRATVDPHPEKAIHCAYDNTTYTAALLVALVRCAQRMRVHVHVC